MKIAPVPDLPLSLRREAVSYFGYSFMQHLATTKNHVYALFTGRGEAVAFIVYRFERQISVDYLYVKKEHRGNGYGRYLFLQTAEKYPLVDVRINPQSVSYWKRFPQRKKWFHTRNKRNCRQLFIARFTMM